MIFFIFVGFSVLELSKLAMYDFHYNKFLSVCPNAKVLFTDTGYFALHNYHVDLKST